nr:IS110 family transposase [Edaphobacter aggregans]
MEIRSVGIDLGKTTFHLVTLGDNCKVLLKKKFTQKQLIAFTANMQTSLIGMEARSGAHFLGRTLREQGHDVKLIPVHPRRNTIPRRVFRVGWLYYSCFPSSVGLRSANCYLVTSGDTAAGAEPVSGL